MHITSRLAAFALFLALSLWAGLAFACKCEGNINPVKGSVIVFWGKAMEIKPRGAQDRVKFEVNQLYKGEEKESVLVYTNRFSHDCGFRFEVDKTYMVYAYDFYPRGVATSVCWGTAESEAAVPDDKWAEVKPVVPADTKLEDELRKVAKKIVPNCGAKYRVFDAGFSMVLSPHGDPARAVVGAERPSEKLENFRQCVGDGFLNDDNLPRPETPVQIQGWYQREVKQQPVLLDQLPCADGCEDWVGRVKAGLMDLDGPDAADQISANLRSEREECLNGGIVAVGGESHGVESTKRRRDRMLAECAMQRSEFDQAEPYLDRILDETLRAAIAWAKARAAAKPEGAPKYPLGEQTPSFAEHALGSKAGAGKFRGLRVGFYSDPLWFASPVYLEAFAESVLADASAPAPMRDLAALAYERAGLLLPDAAEAYKRLADNASDTSEAKQMRTELRDAHAAANAPVVEEAAPVVEEVAVQQVVETPEPAQSPTLLIVAAVLIVVAVAGIGAILKRRG